MEKTDIKNIINLLNKLLNDKSFLIELCSYSNNDVNRVINNLGEIINYYLNNPSAPIEENISDLFYRVLSEPSIGNDNYLIYPTTSYFENRIRMFGLNSPFDKPKNLAIELNRLERQLSQNTIGYKENQIEIYSDVSKSLSLVFSSPSIIYNSILKQPKTKEKPLIVGATESSYYESILDERLENIRFKTHQSLQTSHRTINAFIGKKPLLVIFPSKVVNLSTKDLEKHRTREYIPTRYLSFLHLPTKYELQQICAYNKNNAKGTLVDYNTLNPYVPKIIKEPELYVTYSRYEKIPVTKHFIYRNEELTGDIDYDIDLIYGMLDTNGTKDKISSSFDENIIAIKKRYDIIVEKIGNEYEIKNGRHRILYLKNYYVQNYESYKKIHALDKLLEIVSLPMHVDLFIEDPKFNKIIGQLIKNYKIRCFKADHSNDLPAIVLIKGQDVYYLDDVNALNEFYQNTINNQDNSKFYLGKHSKEINYDYRYISSYLIIKLGSKIYNMSFDNIIRYLFINGFYYEGVLYKPTSLNIDCLYSEYRDLRYHIDMALCDNNGLDFIEQEKIKTKLIKYGNKIIKYLEEHPEDIELTWDKLLIKLRSIDNELVSIDDETLLKAAHMCGYHILKYNSILKANTMNCKKTKNMLK